MRILLIGPPGSGKGTQAAAIKEKYNICTITTDGDEGFPKQALSYRDAPNTVEAEAYYKAHGFIPVDLSIGMLRDTIARRPECSEGFILEGFPRSAEQAEALLKAAVTAPATSSSQHHNHRQQQENHQDSTSSSSTATTTLHSKLTAKTNAATNPLKIDKIINFTVSDDVLIERVSGRMIHPSSRRIYHRTFAPPLEEGKDDVTREPLVYKSDEAEIGKKKEELAAYHRSFDPVCEYLRAHTDCFFDIDTAQRAVGEVRKEVMLTLDGPNNPPPLPLPSSSPNSTASPWWRRMLGWQ